MPGTLPIVYRRDLARPLSPAEVDGNMDALEERLGLAEQAVADAEAAAASVATREWYPVDTATPAPEIGANGDLAITPNGDIWQMAGGVWATTGVNILGPAGPWGALAAPADAAEARTTLGLGTGATATATTGTTDTTIGRLLRVGDHGFGALSAKYLAVRNVDSVSNAAGLFRVDGTDTGTKPWGVSGVALINVWVAGTPGTVGPNQIAWDGTRMYYRDNAATTTTWREVYSTGTLVYAQNTSAALVASNGTVAGSGLTPAQTGTWRNVSGNDIANNGYGLWRIV